MRAARTTAIGALLALAIAGPAGASEAEDARPARAEPTADAGAPPSPERVRFARRMLEDARRLEREGRLEAAARTTARGLRAAPDDARLHRLRAEILDRLGDRDEAARHRARANALDPPPAPLPGAALAPRADGRPSGTGWLIVLVPAPPAPHAADSASAMARTAAEAAIARRLALRLPGARVVRPPALDPPTLPARRAWLARQGAAPIVGIRLERAYCADTIKDGRFGRAVLRVAREGDVHRIAAVTDDETLDETCAARQAERALEAALTGPALSPDLVGPARGPSDDAMVPSREAVLALFPELGAGVRAALDDGRRRLAAGELEAARDAFRLALRIDPSDLDARFFLFETERTLALARELASAEGGVSAERRPDDWHRLEPTHGPADQRGLAEQLAAEQRRRDELLATLALLGGGDAPPDPEQVARLRRGAPPPPGAPGAVRARAVLARGAEHASDDPARIDSTDDLETRVLHAPAGELLARYYFAAGHERPILVEQDTTGDGRLDRWVAWPGDGGREVWEGDRGAGLPDVHLVYGEGGEVERIELTPVNRTRPERVFVYRDGSLRSEFRDTGDDGRFDEIRHFDPDGSLALEETDLDGDGAIDVRTRYRSGRMIRREIMSPEAAEAVR